MLTAQLAARTEIWVKDRLPGFHCWPDAPAARAYLADRHRHMFDVRVTVEVGHVARDVEFFELTDEIKAWWGAGERECGASSCEAVAVNLGEHLLSQDLVVTSVEVSIDGEGGAVTHWRTA